MLKTSSHDLSTSRKHTTGFLVKNFGECCGSTVLTAACYWPSNHCIPQTCVRVGRVKSRPFTVGVGVRQGLVLLPLLSIVNISGSQPFCWRASNPDLQFCRKASLKIFLTQFNLAYTFFYSRTKSITQNIRRFIERLLRAAQRVPGSQMWPLESELRTAGLHELDRQSQQSRRGCHSREVQDQPFISSRRFSTASIFSTVFSMHSIGFLLREADPEWKLALNIRVVVKKTRPKKTTHISLKKPTKKKHQKKHSLIFLWKIY